MHRLALLLAVLLFAGCLGNRPQRGGGSVTTLGGSTAATTVATSAPENPQTPTTSTIEKTVVREYTPRPEPTAADLQCPVQPAAESPVLSRETVTERSTVTTGAAQKDTARELGTRLASLRGVQWFGLLLLIGGPVVGWKLGWLTNGCIAGAVGLLLVILSAVLPGNEVWFGLGGLLLIPLVAYAWYHGNASGKS